MKYTHEEVETMDQAAFEAACKDRLDDLPDQRFNDFVGALMGTIAGISMPDTSFLAAVGLSLLFTAPFVLQTWAATDRHDPFLFQIKLFIAIKVAVSVVFLTALILLAALASQYLPGIG